MGKVEIGMRFGDYTVVAGPFGSSNGGGSYVCECAHGNAIFLTKTGISRNPDRRCGCKLEGGRKDVRRTAYEDLAARAESEGVPFGFPDYAAYRDFVDAQGIPNKKLRSMALVRYEPGMGYSEDNCRYVAKRLARDLYDRDDKADCYCMRRRVKVGEIIYGSIPECARRLGVYGFEVEDACRKTANREIWTSFLDPCGTVNGVKAEFVNP